MGASALTSTADKRSAILAVPYDREKAELTTVGDLKDLLTHILPIVSILIKNPFFTWFTFAYSIQMKATLQTVDPRSYHIGLATAVIPIVMFYVPYFYGQKM